MSDSLPTRARAMVRETYSKDALSVEAVGLLRELADLCDTYREALEAIKAGPPQEGNLELQGVHHEDARYVYPLRMKWIRDRARLALATGEQTKETEAHQ